ncbi:uncharacterized protein K452DRAFT_293866 [Aplosporella prunicola CBS 121167]|uniref:Kinesin motor domain-containing protein n=1 Tax=Aplosporella prunicola CBS 121167 TaxID=1176127 RepID=A0A6A6BTL0_9PEZI|nr:uncharacterized protein K452DRAFT_293866 [Aplosporella prunicola CBS 121167]KAF2147452.1 hypothetical protein K452DRAFT_293866 [Aplosporella prunicola CBS 121167]
MSVRVLARIRPLLKAELDKDTIVTAEKTGADENVAPSIVRIPNPKNDAESFSFQFNSVYDRETTQHELFDKEVAPTVKHLFNGFDVTIFAYGVTGTGKTHTMRGGKSLADRGVIPRLLSSIYRRCRKMEKDGETQVSVSMSYYEIYNDRVYDLFEPPEKRTPAGLPIRDNNGKTVVVGLTERPCTTLKEFEQLYDEANVNRSTSATKLNAHSSRSHAILCVTVTQTTATHTRVSRASAIDLAGSEDNRRTDNNRERLVESAAINKSLFVLAQCVEAISKKQHRIPYRESKMTRILALGQNNGLTLMILNLAPVRSYHLDTLSSLNFANRTKKIEVAEVENEPVLKMAPPKTTSSVGGPTMARQPLRALAAAANAKVAEPPKKTDKPVKAFSVYTDKSKPAPKPTTTRRTETLKRGPVEVTSSTRPAKSIRAVQSPGYGRQPAAAPAAAPAALSKEAIEELIERRLDEKLAERALNETSTIQTQDISEAVQKRLDDLERRVGKEEDGRAEGLHFLLMAKQHHVRGEDISALKMYQLALPHFPENEKLSQKILDLQEKIRQKKEARSRVEDQENAPLPVEVKTRSMIEPIAARTHTTALAKQPLRRPISAPVSAAPTERVFSRKAAAVAAPAEDVEMADHDDDRIEEEDELAGNRSDDNNDAADADYKDDADAYQEDDSFVYKPKAAPKRRKKAKMHVFRDTSASATPTITTSRNSSASSAVAAAVPVPAASRTHSTSVSLAPPASDAPPMTPRTQRLLHIINTRDLAQIKLLKGVGAKKAEAIVNCLCEMDGAVGADQSEERLITDLEQLGGLKGVGFKSVENMRLGLGVAV